MNMAIGGMGNLEALDWMPGLQSLHKACLEGCSWLKVANTKKVMRSGRHALKGPLCTRPELAILSTYHLGILKGTPLQARALFQHPAVVTHRNLITLNNQ